MSNNALTTARIWNRHCKTNEKLKKDNIPLNTITYEELIGNTKLTIQNLLNRIVKSDFELSQKSDFEQQPFYDRIDEKHILVSEPPIIGRISAWKNELSAADIAIIEHVCYDNMVKYNYELQNKSMISRSKYILLFLFHWIDLLYWKAIVLLRKIRFTGLIKSQ